MNYAWQVNYQSPPPSINFRIPGPGTFTRAELAEMFPPWNYGVEPQKKEDIRMNPRQRFVDQIEKGNAEKEAEEARIELGTRIEDSSVSAYVEFIEGELRSAQTSLEACEHEWHTYRELYRNYRDDAERYRTQEREAVERLQGVETEKNKTIEGLNNVLYFLVVVLALVLLAGAVIGWSVLV